MKYDKNNIFAKMIRGEMPCNKIFENDVCIAFHDIYPKAPVHVLVVPKGEFISFNDFTENADPKFISDFFKAVRQIANQLNLQEGGYRVLFNHGKFASQTVFHFHAHIMGGGSLHGI
jgi:histidine triad (HIT) family protein